MPELDYDHVEEKIVNWLRNQVKDCGMEGCVVGLSGGIDSAVTSVLCKKAFPDNTLGVIMPCYSGQEDGKDARKIADKFNIEYISKDLTPVLDEFLYVLEGKKDYEANMEIANMKPRLRMVTLYYYAAKNNYLVIGTDNWSELKVGYFTKHGDGGVDIAPLGRLVKTEVRELAGHLGIPEKIINKPPSAGLWEGQTDEAEMGISYEVLDDYILTGKASQEKQEKIEDMSRTNSHKLDPIPMPDRADLRK